MDRAAVRRGWVAAALICAVSVPAGAEIYHWTDAAGHEHFTSDPAQVPAGALHPAGGGARSGEGTLNGGGRGTPGRTPAPPPASAGQAGGAARIGSAAASGDTAGGHDEDWWRQERSRQVSAIDALDAKVASCKNGEAPRAVDPATGSPAERHDTDRRASAFEACSEASSTLEAKRRDLESFDENARQQGVPPGWLR